MKPVVKVIQTAKNEKQAWRKLDDLELFKYYNFRMNTSFYQGERPKPRD